MLSSLVLPRPVKSSRLTFGDSTSSNLHMHIAHTSRSGDDKLEKNGDTLLPFDDLGDMFVFPPPGTNSKGGDNRVRVRNCDKFCGVWNDRDGDKDEDGGMSLSVPP